jgi:Predicted dehydrogenases and related proteins
MNEKCSHDLDLICNMKKGQAEPSRVYSVAGTQMFPAKDTPATCPECRDGSCPFRYQTPSPGNQHYQLAENNMNVCVFRSDADIFNIQSVTITFHDGTQAIHTLIPYTGGEAHRSVFIHGTEGFLHAFQGESSCSLEIAIYRESGMQLKPILLNAPANDGHGGGDSFILDDLFDCIEENRKPDASVYDGLRASLIAFAADESARTGQVIDLKDRLARIR